MSPRPKSSTRDLKLAQGKQRDAYFERLRRQSQPRKAATAVPTLVAQAAPEAPAAALSAPEAPAAE
jgi:hypothetical protein